MVEKKTGVLAVLSTPLLELPIQRILTKANNWSKNDDWANRPPIGDTSIMNRCVINRYTMQKKRVGDLPTHFARTGRGEYLQHSVLLAKF